VTGALETFTGESFTAEGSARTIYRSGTGPAVIVLSELPGITPRVADFGRTVAQAGLTAVLPHLFGQDGRGPSFGYVASTFTRACISREFTALAAGRTSPVITWLRVLAAEEHKRCGGPGVGVVGMCFTGGFALGMMADDTVVAPVLAQPSLPLPLTRRKRADLGLSPSDLDRLVERASSGT
jgi:dienelactone hydrolase